MTQKQQQKQKPPNTLLSSQTTPAGRATRLAAFGRLLIPRTSKDTHRSGVSLWDAAALSAVLAVSQRLDQVT